MAGRKRGSLTIQFVEPDGRVSGSQTLEIMPADPRLLAAANKRKKLAKEIVREQDPIAAVAFFFSAVDTGTAKQIHDALEVLQKTGAVRRGFKKLARRRLNDDTKIRFHGFWTTYGASVRNVVGDDLLLLDTLRTLLPKYNGQALTLYRGECASSRTRRTYGLSWTTSKAAARMFAQRSQHFDPRGQSVLLETRASEHAILCGPNDHSRNLDEDEYVVDRRKLSSVKVIERFPPSAH